ncbi:MAG: hypothetical protein KKB66_06130 [Alphaproteobacteria bacterium]|jgi:hypothetical protein|nr:hypothetical protein [Alphaproteobacteria bacterium]MBU0805943.1 hypothetical protein [Alphaproteobacteria bacterium]MBU0874088.1 hypothetical protein [Alphaproteobacteria bacterium]MBU1402088.1 hypothetical protein [Alphaproteobacteria bacterium]MBU1590733.1 hypothetical protein [Alphaproteobacteria bacterium]
MGAGFFIFSGVWALAMLAVFIKAIRLSYRIEARSEGLRNTLGVPQKAMMIHTAFNWKVARDPETQALRRRMLFLLALNLAGFVLLWGALWMTGSVADLPNGAA